jgi:D-amino-acid dehydrogenase
MLYAARVRQPLLESSTHLYHMLMREEQLQCEWQNAGCLFLFQTPRGRAHFDQTIERLAPFGFSGDAINGTDLQAFEPSLKSDLNSGFFYGHDAHLHPGKLMDSMRTILVRHGVRIIENSAVRRFDIHDGKAHAAITDHGSHPADAFVLAAGARSPALRARLGCPIPIVPAKGYSTTMARPAICPTRPLYFHEKRVVATPMDTAYRLGSTLEFAGFDSSLHPNRIRMLREGAEGFMNDPHPDPAFEEWYGYRPMTSDGIPMIGLAPKSSNLCIAAGHNMDGISMGPGSGKLVSEILAGVPTHIDAKPYRPNRF